MSLLLLYFKSMIGYMLVALPIFIIIRLIFLKKTNKKINKIHELSLIVFVMYLVGLVSQTIIPQWNMGFISDTGEFYFEINVSNENASVNIIPFYTLSQYFFESNEYIDDWSEVSLLNILANVLLFSPLGYLIPLLWHKYSSFMKITIIGITITCFVEFIQFFIGRSTDIDDVILNTVGVILGYTAYLLFKKIVDLKKKNKF